MDLHCCWLEPIPMEIACRTEGSVGVGGGCICHAHSSAECCISGNMHKLEQKRPNLICYSHAPLQSCLTLQSLGFRVACFSYFQRSMQLFPLQYRVTEEALRLLELFMLVLRLLCMLCCLVHHHIIYRRFSTAAEC